MYSKYKKSISNYPNDSKRMNNEYLNLFELLLEKKQAIVESRNLFRSPILLFKNLVFILMRIKNVVKFFRRLILRKFI